MSALTDKLKNHAKKATVETAALKTVIVHPILDNRDRDLVYKHLLGVATDDDLRDLSDLADKIAKA